jgi:hypothetical protein
MDGGREEQGGPGEEAGPNGQQQLLFRRPVVVERVQREVDSAEARRREDLWKKREGNLRGKINGN